MSFRFDPTPIATPPTLDLDRLAETRGSTIASELRDAFVPTEACADQLDRLFAGDALVVTTGQQPGLLTGPLFTIYKGLTAIAAARAFEAALQRPVVPVFWVAGDDHDLAESNHIHQVTPDQDVERLSLGSRQPDDPLVPLYREPLGREVERVLARISEATPDTEFRNDVLSWLGRHYRAEATYAEAFAGAMAELLGPHGLVVFRPTHAAAKRVMRSCLLRALQHASDLDRRLADRTAAMERDGMSPPVPVGDGATLVMLEGAAGRDRLMIDGDGFVTRRAGERLDRALLSDLAEQEPERLSPNVLLRPVVEAAILPTLGYVGGPGELAYLPQCRPVYEALDVEPQTPLPRWSARVVEARITKVLEKYEIAPDDLTRPEGALEASLVRDEMPEDAQTALRTLRKVVQEEFGRLEQAATAIDPTLKKPVLSTRNSTLKDLGHVEKRIVSHLKNRNEIVTTQIAKARTALYPNGRPQERVLNIAGFLIRYGPGFIESALDAAREALPALESRSGAS